MKIWEILLFSPFILLKLLVRFVLIHLVSPGTKRGGVMSDMTQGYSVAELEADILVPSQFFDRRQAEGSAQPEKRLMLAVMEDAIATFQKSFPEANRRQRRLLRETEEWIQSNDASWPFSFENICAALDIEADYLRQGLFKWKTAQQARYRERSDPHAPALHSPFRRISGRRRRYSWASSC